MAGLTSPRYQESPAAHSTLAVLLRDNKQPSESLESHYDSTPSSSLEMEEEVADSAKSVENNEQPYDLSIRKRIMSKPNCPDKSSHRPFANVAWPLVSAAAQNGEYTQETSAPAAHNGHTGKSDTSSHGRGEDDDSTVGSMLRGMNQLRHKRLLCDVSFLLRGEEFHAHKAVMAACSEYCHERIIQLSECHSQTNQPLAITLSDALSCDGLRTLLDFVYTGKLEVNDDGALLEETLLVANHLRVPKLVHACNQHRFEAENRRTALSSLNPLQLKSEAADVGSAGASSPPSSLDLSGESCGLESKERCVDLYRPLQEAFHPTKPRRASESYASMLDDREMRERPWMLGQSGSIFIPPDEVVRILHHSKSEGEAGNNSDHGSDLCSNGSGGRSSRMGLAKCEDGRRADVGADVYQPVHWKKREFNGRRAEKHQQQITHGNARSPFTPNGNTDEVFSDNEPATSASAEFARRLSTSMAANAGAIKSYFPYAGFAPGRGSGGHLESLLPVPPYTDLTSPFIPSLFAFPFGSNGRNAALDAHSLSYLRNRAQSYDVNQHARFRRDAHPLLAPSCGPIISSLLGHQQSPFHYHAPDRGIGSNGQVNGNNNNNPPQRRKTTSPESNGLNRFHAIKRQRSESATNSFSPISLNMNSTDQLPKQTSVGQANASAVNGTARSKNDTSSYRLKNFLKKTPESGKPYKCLLCDANFNRPANLKTHMRIHSGEKPYKCENCGARFVQVAHLRAHILIHTGEKPYPCTVCGTKFRHLQTLKSHLRIHTGEKPYSCEQCSVQFRHKSQLRLHLRTKHGIQTNTKKTYKQVPGLSSADICAHIKRAQEAVKTQAPNKLNETPEMMKHHDGPATSNNSFDNGFVQTLTPENLKCRSEEPSSGDASQLRPLGGNSGLFKINMKARLETIGESASRFDLPSLAMTGGHRVGINVP